MKLLLVYIVSVNVMYAAEMVLLSAIQLRTDSTCVAIFKSSILYPSENVSLHFRILSLYLLTKNCSVKNEKLTGVPHFRQNCRRARHAAAFPYPASVAKRER